MAESKRKKAGARPASARKKTVKPSAAKGRGVAKKAADTKKTAKSRSAAKKAPAKKTAAPKKPAKAAAAAKKKTSVKKVTAAKKVSRKVPKATPVSKPAVQNREDVIRKILVNERDSLLKESQAEIEKYIKGESRQLVETALDDGDWSIIDLSEDINLRKLGTNRETLAKIDTALRKLGEGSYGICEECGEDINTERLRILPFAIYCRDCQEKKEILEAAGKE